MNTDDTVTLKIETIGILIDAYYTDNDIVAVLGVDMDTVKNIRAKYYKFMMKYSA